ncbi:MAG: hypothetical protein GY762_19425 [Proteobacteria bacterium]|nr:hypothetical protein [Pseudomonadota bacterium]
MKMRLWVLCTIISLAMGCAGAKKDADHGGDAPRRLGRIDSGSRCKVKDDQVEEQVDLNQDGEPDVRRVFIELQDGTRVLVCRESDLDFDGVRDVFVFYDEEGEIIRDEVNLDYKDQVDIISIYSKGKIVKQEIDTNSDSQIDRVRYLEDGVPIRVEGDTDGNGVVDYWEYYEEGKLIRIGVDQDGDGKADDWSRDRENEPADAEAKEEKKP